MFNEIIEESPLRIVKGRSDRLDSQRNQCLVERWLYMMKVTGWRYELMLRMISRDFFLSDRRVIDLLNENNDLLRSIRIDLPLKKDLEKRWPQFSWETPTLEQYI